MKELPVSVEINGIQTQVGTIRGETVTDARFAYDREYIAAGLPQISLHLPVSEYSFSPEETKIFFEGLLPEGFARKSVAEWIHASEEDYLTILETLGAECLGAIRIAQDSEFMSGYEKLSMEEVKALAAEGVSKSTELVTQAHLSLTGASGKVGLYYDDDTDSWYMPHGDAPSTHIVKQSHVRLSGIVTNEQLSLQAASELGIEIPESSIINIGDGRDDEILFATKRYDRIINCESKMVDGLRCPFRLHQEDFAQAMGIPAQGKYEKGEKGYLGEMFRIIRSSCADPITDQLKLWDILVYDFLVGNTDNHIKNLSLIYSADLRSIRLAPAYDIVSTAIYQGSSREMAIGIGGERNLDMISRNNFEEAADEAGINRKTAMKRFDVIADGFEKAVSDTAYVLAQQGYSGAYDTAEKILKHGGYGHI